MDLGKVKEIIALFENSSLVKLEISDNEGSVSMEKATEVVQVMQPIAPQTIQVVEETCVTSAGEPVVSPLVGTYYASASEGGTPFVEVGKKVKKGDTLCILEAMKVMNEIKAEHDGTIVEVCKKNGDMVQFGDVLMYIE